MPCPGARLRRRFGAGGGLATAASGTACPGARLRRRFGRMAAARGGVHCSLPGPALCCAPAPRGRGVTASSCGAPGTACRGSPVVPTGGAVLNAVLQAGAGAVGALSLDAGNMPPRRCPNPHARKGADGLILPCHPAAQREEAPGRSARRRRRPKHVPFPRRKGGGKSPPEQGMKIGGAGVCAVRSASAKAGSMRARKGRRRSGGEPERGGRNGGIH